MALFGKNNHRSVLDEDSTFYLFDDSQTEKEKWASMDPFQRMRYFMDYYFLKCLVLLFAVALAGVLLYSCLSPKKTKILFIAVVQNTLLPEGKEQLQQRLENLFSADPARQEVLLDDTFPMGLETEAKLTAYIASKEVDLIITDEEKFKELAQAGCFEDLDQFMPELAAYDSNLFIRGGSKNNTTYGIRMTNCPVIKDAWISDLEPVIGILANSQRKNNSRHALSSLLSELL